MKRWELDRRVTRMFPATAGTWVKSVDAEAAIKAARQEALEEAAQACSGAIGEYEKGYGAAQDCAEAVRALKVP